jgi:two-component system, cell cycle response regulator DivK
MAGKLIMIVEDNERNLKLLRDVLSAYGYRTVEARSGEEAVTLARTEHPELVLMDIQLPGMDGVAALHELRGLAESAATPIVAVTAFVMKEDRDRFLAAGFDAYLEKPVDVHELRSCVASYLGAATAGTQS